MANIFQKKRFYMLLTLGAFLFFAYQVLELRMTDEAARRITKDNGHGFELKATYYEANGKQMRYLEIGCDTLPMMMMLHGSPSSSMSWQALLRDSVLLSKAYLVAVDRPGYGFSSFGDIQTSIVKQAEMIAPILKEKRKIFNKILVVGSSYGGPVAVRLAMEYPDLVDGIMLQSSSMEPGAEKIYDITYPTSKPPLKYMIPTVFRNANAEKLAHKDALLEIDNDWHKVKSKVTIFHGKKDNLIYFSNALYAQSKLINAESVNLVAVEDGEHGMLWSKTELVKKTMINALKEL
jgi:pimeloyl-ACP methyl ester carboxylesterase